MKKYLIVFILFLLMASPSLGEDNKPDMMKGAKLNEQTIPTTAIVVGANDAVGSIAEPGWPIIVSAAIVSDQEIAPPIPANLQIKMINENTQGIPIAFEPVATPEGSDLSQIFWIIAESATQSLTPGNYQITIGPIKGLRIESGELQVVAANPENGASLDLLKIQKSLLIGKDDEALAQADVITTSDATNLDAWVAKGDILMGKDLPDEAIKAYEKALELAEKEDDEPLFIEERHRAALFRSLEKRGVIEWPDEQ